MPIRQPKMMGRGLGNTIVVFRAPCDGRRGGGCVRGVWLGALQGCRRCGWGCRACAAWRWRCRRCDDWTSTTPLNCAAWSCAALPFSRPTSRPASARLLASHQRSAQILCVTADQSANLPMPAARDSLTSIPHVIAWKDHCPTRFHCDGLMGTIVSSGLFGAARVIMDNVVDACGQYRVPAAVQTLQAFYSHRLASGCVWVVHHSTCIFARTCLLLCCTEWNAACCAQGAARAAAGARLLQLHNAGDAGRAAQ